MLPCGVNKYNFWYINLNIVNFHKNIKFISLPGIISTAYLYFCQISIINQIKKWRKKKIKWDSIQLVKMKYELNKKIFFFEMEIQAYNTFT